MTVIQKRLTNDLHLIKLTDGDSLLYAPLRQRALKLTPEQVIDVENETEVGKSLLDLHHFSDTISRDPEAPKDIAWSPFNYNTVFITLTSACNLRCTYCYADGGDYNGVITWDILEAWMDHIPGAARRNGGVYNVNFLGDGEAMVQQELLFTLCDRLNALAKANNFTINLSLTTNGTLINESNIEKIKSLFNSIAISFDGDERAQGINRPHADGKSSISSVMKAFHLLNQYGINFGIRSTITIDSVERMAEMVDFMVDCCHCKFLHMEPATCTNRAGISLTPGAEDFVKNFRKAQIRASVRGVQLFTSNRRTDNFSKVFCEACNAGANLLSNGNLTSCSRITHDTDKHFKKYSYGKFDPASRTWIINSNVITKLRTKTTLDGCGKECFECFAKWHCAGGCPANKDGGNGPLLCYITKELTLDNLLSRYDKNDFLNQKELIQNTIMNLINYGSKCIQTPAKYYLSEDRVNSKCNNKCNGNCGTSK